jgi:hypothetical protein
MEREELDRLNQQFDQVVRERFPGAPIKRTTVLQYGDDPEIEPGQLLARVYLEEPGDKETKQERGKALESFREAHREAILELRRDLDKIHEAGPLEFVVSGEEGERRGPKLRLMGNRGALETENVALTPVMARLGAEDLQTVDTLITAGIAGNRAEAVRWALARIRERPAYAQLQDRAREIEELKTQF